MEARVAKPKILPSYESRYTVEVLGMSKSYRKKVEKTTGETFDIPATGFFVAIGHKPNTIFSKILSLVAAQ
jgi:thioredoxin reductase (NADPH)